MVTQALRIHTPDRRRHLIGVLIVVAVAIIWTFAAELIQFILQGKSGKNSFDKPYFLTYFSVSLFSVLLSGFVFPSWRAKTSWDATQPTEHPIRGGSNPAIIEGEYDLDYEADQPARPQLSIRSVLKIGAQLAPFFFLSSWTYSVGLDMTSVASSTTISALTTLFTLMLGASIGSVRFTMGKLMATALSIAGVAIISQQDTTTEEQGKRHLSGDLISIGSSFVYALYTILLDSHTDRAKFSVSMMLGFLGLVTLVTFWPGLFLCSLLGWETFEMPKGQILAMLLVNGFIGTVLSDFLWAKSVELAGPMIGTLSLSLGVPFSVIADHFLHDTKFAMMYLIGTLLVLIGFLLMNYEIARDREMEREQVAGIESVSDSELEALS